METMAGLWIDHRKAVIACVTAGGEEIMEIRSNVERQPGRVGGSRSLEAFESQMVVADDSQQRAFTGQLDKYYQRVIAGVLDAETVFIFGPGEAKGEFRKLLEQTKYKGQILPLETTDKLTNPQIVAKVREQFLAFEHPTPAKGNV
ncbi:MAG: hypothetical protein Q8O00_05790 [Holophaga sp.]|nr:hypothetical protein [Holophaga sp.]